MKILITGTGFLGSMLIDNLSKYHEVYYTSTSINGSNRVAIDFSTHLFTDCYYDIVIHCAASIPIPENIICPSCYIINLEGTLNFYRRIKDKCKTFIYISSTAVYGEYQKDNVTQHTFPKPDSSYSISKYTAELILKQETNTTSNLIIVRPGTIYGKNMKKFRAIPFILNKIKNNEKIIIYDSNKIFNLIAIDDIIDIIKKLIDNATKYNGCSFNLVSENLTKREFTEIIKNSFKNNAEIEYIENYKVLNKTIDTNCIKLLDRDFSHFKDIIYDI